MSVHAVPTGSDSAAARTAARGFQQQLQQGFHTTSSSMGILANSSSSSKSIFRPAAKQRQQGFSRGTMETPEQGLFCSSNSKGSCLETY